MQFIYSPLTWAFFAVLAPLLIHLINLLRHRRVKWAAMEFLLKSYKKHRTWVWLKQFLLLLLRMATVAAIVAMCAKLITHDQWSRIFGGKTTHHYLLLDDSLSMSEKSGGAAAFDRALDALTKIVDRAAQEGTSQKLTLIRFSRAASTLLPAKNGGEKSAGDGASASQSGSKTKDQTDSASPASSDDNARAQDAADCLAETLHPEKAEFLQTRFRQFQVSELAASPAAALRTVEQLLPPAGEENAVLYVLSDFRASEWDSTSELLQLLKPLQTKGAEIELVRCVKDAQPNLSVVHLGPADATRAAGVPLKIEVKVKNCGLVDAANVTVKIRTTYYDPEKAIAGAATPGHTEDAATILIDKLGSGETASRQTQVMFPRPGQHVVEAIIPDDALAVDNRRRAVVEVLAGMPVLVVDGDSKMLNGYFLDSIFKPGERANTGVRPVSKTAAYLRDAASSELSAYRAIYLLDVPRLDERSVLNLETYVRGGGGLALFTGPTVNQSNYNELLYKNGQGLFPLPLERPDSLARIDQRAAPDLQITSHPIFLGLTQKNNPLIDSVDFAGYWKTPADWKPVADSGVAVLARLRNFAPLVVERRYGGGRVVAVLSTLRPEWNNWARGPALPIVLLNLQSYLASAGQQDRDDRVGDSIELKLDPAKFNKDVTFLLPSADGEQSSSIKLDAAAPPPVPGPEPAPQGERPPPDMVATLGQASVGDRHTRPTDQSGVYQAIASALDGKSTITRYALNGDPLESEVRLTDFRTLRDRLEPIRTRLNSVEDFTLAARESNDSPWSQRLLWVLLVMLVGEQFLAYLASYHAPRKGAA